MKNGIVSYGVATAVLWGKFKAQRKFVRQKRVVMREFYGRVWFKLPRPRL